MEHFVIVLFLNGELYGLVGPFPSREEALAEFRTNYMPLDMTCQVRPAHQPVLYGGEPLTL